MKRHAERAIETDHTDLSGARGCLAAALGHLEPLPKLTLDLGGAVTLDLVLIPPGEFMMGSGQSAAEVARLDSDGKAGWYEDEHPQHLVRITKPFYMGVTEVTQGQYEAVTGRNPSSGPKVAQHPVEEVSWHDAVEFCRKLSARTGREVRLPTEAEWEYACRAGTTTPFHTGNTISTDQATYDGTYTYGTGGKVTYRTGPMPVGSFKANGWGLFDMHGSAWEWCQDWYDGGYYRQGTADDPSGPTNGDYRVLRGGSGRGNPGYCRSANRFRTYPWDAHDVFGFRVVVSPGTG